MESRRNSARHDAVRITTAASGRDQEIAARQRRYIISMAVRVVCFIGAVAVGPGWLRWVLVAGAVLLPYVAVVLANATDNRQDDFALRDARPQHELPPAAAPRPGEGAGREYREAHTENNGEKRDGPTDD